MPDLGPTEPAHPAARTQQNLACPRSSEATCSESVRPVASPGAPSARPARSSWCGLGPGRRHECAGGCSASGPNPRNPPDDQLGAAGLPNPWVDFTSRGSCSECHRDFAAGEGQQRPVWSVNGRCKTRCDGRLARAPAAVGSAARFTATRSRSCGPTSRPSTTRHRIQWTGQFPGWVPRPDRRPWVRTGVATWVRRHPAGTVQPERRQRATSEPTGYANRL